MTVSLPMLHATGASASTKPSEYQRIILSTNSPEPVRTAAAELFAKTGAVVVQRDSIQGIGPQDIVLALGEEALAYPEAKTALTQPILNREWELVQRVESGGLLIAGPTSRNVCHAALAWAENPEDETDRLSVFQFEERFTMWDNGLNQWYRFSEGFDRKQHLREIALLGHTGIEINRYADSGGYHVLHRKFPQDSYAWYLSYAPALDAFVESSLTAGIYPQEELATNLADLSRSAELAQSYGLKPGFVCYEPRSVSEEIFNRFPQLRGSRTDHPGRSLEPRYALDIANPRVLQHYAELITNLMAKVPDLRYLVFWTQDSGSGLPFSRRLYFGPNGSYLARSKTLEQMAADFSGTLLEAGRKINPEFEVIMKMDWEYTAKERQGIVEALPEGVAVSHILGHKVLRNESYKAVANYVRDDRERDKEPYMATIVSTMWDDAPVFGVPSPNALNNRFKELRKLKIRRLFTLGGVLSSPQCPYSINQALYQELIRGPVDNLDEFLLKTALRWCQGNIRAASQLVRAWKAGDETFADWPFIKWYDAGAGQTQGRWLTRPVVPDITQLNPDESLAWERALFTLPWDIGRKNIAFEGGIRMYEDDQLDKAVEIFRKQTIPQLAKVVNILEQELAAEARLVIQDQHDRYRGLLLLANTVCNTFDAQVSINHYLLEQGDRGRLAQRLDDAIGRELVNTREWIQMLKQSKTNFFRLASKEETPFLYKTPIEDLQRKLEAMEAHRSDVPGPFLKELAKPHSENTLLFYSD